MMFSTFHLDVRQAWRSLQKSPGFLIAAILSLGLGLGINIAVLSLVDQLLLRPLPYPGARHLVMVEPRNPNTGDTGGPLTMADFLDVQRQTKSCESMAAATDRNRTLEGLEEPLRVNVGMVTANYFQLLGVKPKLGRVIFTAEEEAASHATVVVLRHEFWRERLGGDPKVLGRTLVLDGRALQVIGVLPASFRPMGRLYKCQVITPEAISFVGRDDRNVSTFEVLGRLRPDVTLQQGNAEIHAAALHIAAATGDHDFDLAARSLHEEVTRPLRPILVMLQLAVALVLVIACFNVASLQLVRNTARSREMVIRKTLGASPLQLWRQFLAESLVLGVLGSMVGLVLSLALQQALGALVASALDLRLDLGLYPSLIGAGLGLGLFAGLGLALMSGLMMHRTHVDQVLREGTKGTFSRAQRWSLKSLVVAELAVSVALLLGAGLLIQSMINLGRVRPGFQPEHRLVVRVPLPPKTYSELAAQDAFLKRLDPALRAIPGVQAVGVNDTLPLEYAVNGGFVNLGGDTAREYMRIHCITPGYFEAMGIPMERGRTFTPEERDVCVVNRLLAQRLWKGADPLGRVLYMGGKPVTVMGVAGDTVEVGLREKAFAQCYVSAHAEGLFEGAILVLDVKGDPRSYAKAVKQALRNLDPSLAIPVAKTYPEIIRKSYSDMKAFTLLFAGFGATALLLAGIGLYSVLSQMAEQRRREVGIRMSLGALPRTIAIDVLRETAQLTACGLALGAGLGWGVCHALEGQLFGVHAPGALLFLAVLGVLTFITLIASLLPALRAAMTDPAVVLRGE